MKHSFLYFFCCILIWSCNQNQADSKKEAARKEDSATIVSVGVGLGQITVINPTLATEKVKKIHRTVLKGNYQDGYIFYYSAQVTVNSNLQDGVAKALMYADSARRFAEGKSEYIQFAAFFSSGSAYFADPTKFDSSLRFFLFADSISRAHPTREITPSLPSLYMNIATIATAQDNLALAKTYFNKAIMLLGANSDKGRKIACISGLANIANRQHDTLNASRLYKQAMVLATSSSDSLYITIAEEQLGNWYFEMGTIDSAFYYLSRSQQRLEHFNYRLPNPETYITLARCLMAKGKFEDAKQTLGKLNQGLNKSKLEHDLAKEQFLTLAALEKQSGNWQAAYRAMASAFDQQDLSLKAKKDEQLLNYEQQITKLKAESQIREREERLARFKQRVIMGSTMGVLIMTGLIISLVRWRKRKLVGYQLENERLKQQAFFNQLSPHFIFNMLTPLQAEILGGTPTKALDYLSDFVKLMRGMLNRQRTNFMKLAAKVDFLTSYLNLQQIRRKNKFSYQITISPDIDPQHVWLPSLLIQPIVENAIEHGIKGVDDGKIGIDFSVSQNELVITVSDNGVGIPLSDYVKQDHALAILNERIELLKKVYHTGKIQINRPEDNIGTLVTIWLPLFLANPE